MRHLKVLQCLVVVIAVVGAAAADTKVIQMTHQDAFAMAGQPEADNEKAVWIGDDRMRIDEANSSVIVRLDQKKLYMVDHTDKTTTIIDLPFDVTQHLPEGAAEQMKQMMTIDATVTPSDETRTIGDWKARRYGLSMTSPMVSVEATLWATADVGVDSTAYIKMMEQVMSMQPGMADLVTELQKIEGFVIEQESVTTMTIMGGNQLNSSEKTVSVEQIAAPAGTYDPPAEYTVKPFNYMEMMQMGR